jgi:hypothetical protein
MTTPDGTTPEREAPDQISGDPATAPPNPIAREGTWGAVARLLAIQLLTVVAVTAVITGIYALTGRGGNQATVGSASQNTPTASLPPSTPPPAQSTAPPSTDVPSVTSSPSSPATSSKPPVRTKRMKVDVYTESAPAGSAASMVARVRALGWRVGRVTGFHGTVSATTVFYPRGQAKAAGELARALPGNLRVQPRFSYLSGSRLSIILVR